MWKMWNENVEINVRATAGVGWLPTPPDSLGPGRAKYLCGQNAALKDFSLDRVFCSFQETPGSEIFPEGDDQPQ